MEKKTFKQAKLEFKNFDEQGKFEAYVSVFENVDFGGDIVDQKAFNDTLNSGQLFPLLAQHQTDEPIGGFKAVPDGYGLKMTEAFFDLELDEAGNQRNPTAHKYYSLAKKGIITGFSIGFVTKAAVREQVGEKTARRITKAQLMEGSIVTFPMNDKARLTTIKSQDDAEFDEIKSIRDVENYLKDSGLSSKAAKTLISKIKEFSPRDDGETEEKRDAAPCLDLKSILDEIKTNTLLINLKSI